MAMTNKKVINAVFLLTIIGVFAYLLVSAFEPFRLNWGDPWSDGNALTSGRYFAKYGFSATKFTPILDAGPLSEHSLRYTHYPPLPDILNGVYQIAGLKTLTVLRIIAIFFTAFAIFFFYRLIQLIWSDLVAKIAVCFYITNFLFLQYADTLHHVPYYSAFGYAALYFAIRYSDHKTSIFFALSLFLTCLCFLASYDFWFFLPMAAFFLSKTYGRKSYALLVPIVLGGGLGLLTKFGTALYSFGDWSSFVSDLRFQSEERGIINYFDWYYLRGFAAAIFYRTTRVFTPLLIISILFFLCAPLLKKKDTRELSPLFLLISGIVFIFYFPQLVWEQFHPLLHLLPFFSVSIALLIQALWQALCDKQAQKIFVFLIVFIFYLGWQLLELTSIKKSLMPPQDIAEIQTLINDQPGRILLTDGLVDAPIRYYFDRLPLSILGLSEVGLSGHINHILNSLGVSNLWYLHFRDIHEMIYDKILFKSSGFSLLWLESNYPRPYKRFWQASFDEKFSKDISEIEKCSTLVRQNGTFNLYRFDKVSIESQLAGLIQSAPESREINFTGSSSLKYIKNGFGLDIINGDGGIWARLDGNIFPKFTMDGQKFIATKNHLDSEPTLRLKLSPRNYRGAITLTSPMAQSFELFMNDHSLGTFKFNAPNVSQKFPLSLKAAWFKNGLQELIFRFSKFDSRGYMARIEQISFN